MIVRQDQVHFTGSRIQLTLEILKGHRRHHLAVPTFEQGLHALADRQVIIDHPDSGTAKTTIERHGSILVGRRLPWLQAANRNPNTEYRAFPLDGGNRDFMPKHAGYLVHDRQTKTQSFIGL